MYVFWEFWRITFSTDIWRRGGSALYRDSIRAIQADCLATLAYDVVRCPWELESSLRFEIHESRNYYSLPSNKCGAILSAVRYCSIAELAPLLDEDKVYKPAVHHGLAFQQQTTRNQSAFPTWSLSGLENGSLLAPPATDSDVASFRSSRWTSKERCSASDSHWMTTGTTSSHTKYQQHSRLAINRLA